MTSNHPRTVLWFKQREKCLKCTHMLKSKTSGMRCAVTQAAAGRTNAYCIDAREPGQPCGPDALKFVPLKD